MLSVLIYRVKDLNGDRDKDAEVGEGAQDIPLGYKRNESDGCQRDHQGLH